MYPRLTYQQQKSGNIIQQTHLEGTAAAAAFFRAPPCRCISARKILTFFCRCSFSRRRSAASEARRCDRYSSAPTMRERVAFDARRSSIFRILICFFFFSSSSSSSSSCGGGGGGGGVKSGTHRCARSAGAEDCAYARPRAHSTEYSRSERWRDVIQASSGAPVSTEKYHDRSSGVGYPYNPDVIQ